LRRKKTLSAGVFLCDTPPAGIILDNSPKQGNI